MAGIYEFQIRIGNVSEREWTFEWKIEDFYSYIQRYTLHRSPYFHVGKSVWFLRINIRKCIPGDFLCIGLFMCTDKPDNAPVYLKAGIKTANNNIVNEHGTEWTSNGKDKCGWHNFLKYSDLELRQSELLPLGALTVVCCVKVKNNVPDPNAGVEKFVVDMKNMLTSGKDTDVTIKVKEETFSAHKLILAARSPVLAAMFENEMVEKKTGSVCIPDCDPKAFKHFLHYLYSGKLDSEKCDFFNLGIIADKYNVSDLKVMCIKTIISNLSEENFAETSAFAYHLGDAELLAKVHNFFHVNFGKVVSSENWLSLMQENSILAHTILKTMASKFSVVTID